MNGKITEKQLTDVMVRLNGPLYPKVHAIAEQYVKRKLPEHFTPSKVARTASRFSQAYKDFLVRGGIAHDYRADATTLEAALKVIRRDDRRFFDSLIPDGGDRALTALETMAKRLREIAKDYNKDWKNKVFYYCLGRVFGEGLPTPSQANNLLVILIEAMRGIVEVSDIKTDYDSGAIRKRMKAGAKA